MKRRIFIEYGSLAALGMLAAPLVAGSSTVNVLMKNPSKKFT